MFEKKNIILPKEMSSEKTGFASEERIKYTDIGEILLISNDEQQFRIHKYSPEGAYMHTYTCENTFGQLYNVFLYKEILLLEFHEIISAYEEEYHIIKVAESEDVIFSSPRQSYMHEMPYHSLYLHKNQLCLNLIRYDRLHSFTIDPDSGIITELDPMEGGRWYLCKSYALCLVGHTIEVYCSDFDTPAIIEYDYDINDIASVESVGVNAGEFAAFALADITQEHTTILIFNKDTRSLHTAYLEGGVADMGISGGRVWINPYGANLKQDMGGCVIYDKFAVPLYIHMRAKNIQGAVFSGYPPPFHRTNGIFHAKDGTTLVVETGGRLLLFDYAGRAVQDWSMPECFSIAVNLSGSSFCILKLNEPMVMDGVTNHKDASIEIYSWENSYEGAKVVEMIRRED